MSGRPITAASAGNHGASSSSSSRSGDNTNRPQRNTNLAEISSAVMADSDSEFQNSTFALKRTRSMGLFDVSSTPSDAGVHLDQPQPQQRPAGITSPKSSLLQSGLSDLEQLPSSEHEEHISLATGSTTEELGSDRSSSGSTSLPGTPELLAPALDDSVIQYEPSRHVDYLSHNWKESDISSSWRYIVLRRKDMANSARLENASWRTWTKAKYNLKTVAPESVNWLKDYDVTWLYGPLYDEPHHSYSTDHDSDDNKPSTPSSNDHIARSASTSGTVTPLQTAGDREPTTRNNNKSTTANNENQSLPCKPILKKRSASQVILSRLPHAASDWDSYTSNYLRHHNYRHRPQDQTRDCVSYYVNQQYMRSPLVDRVVSTDDDYFALTKLKGPGSSSVASSVRSPSPGLMNLSAAAAANLTPPVPDRHIHFNSRVEQCIAVDISESEDEDSEDEDEAKHGLHMKHQHRSKTQHGGGGWSDDEDSDSDSDDGAPLDMSSRGRARSRTITRNTISSSRFGRSRSAESDESDSEDEEAGLFLNMRSSSSSASLAIKNEKHRTISLLPATTLKYYLEEDEREADQVETANRVAHAMSHNMMSYRSAYSKYDYSSVYVSPDPSPAHSPRESIGSATPVSQTTETVVSGQLVNVGRQSSSTMLGKVEHGEVSSMSPPATTTANNTTAPGTSSSSSSLRNLANSLWTWKK